MCCMALLSDPTSIQESHPTLHAFLQLAFATATSLGSATTAAARTASAAAISRLAGEQQATSLTNAPGGSQPVSDQGAAAAGGAPAAAAASAQSQIELALASARTATSGAVTQAMEAARSMTQAREHSARRES